MAVSQKIRNEDDAWAVLDAWLSKEELPIIEFDGWPRLDIVIKGDAYKSSLNTRQMSAFLDFKKVMGRAYSAIAHGAYDARRLRSYEEDQLELTTTIKEGSSATETDFSSLVNAFAGIVTNNPHMSLAAAIVIGLLFVSKPLISQHLDNRSKQLDSEERGKLLSIIERLTVADKSKIKMLERAVRRISRTYPQFAQAVPDATAAHWRLTSSASDARSLVVAGLELNQEQLEALSERRAYRNVEVEIVEDDFLVLGVVRIQEAYRIQLKSRTAHYSLAYRPLEMGDEKILELAACIPTMQLVRAEIELKTIEKAHVVGRLLRYSILQHPDS